MVQRWKLQKTGLVISQPGIDVSIATDDQKIFDSSWLFTSFYHAYGYYSGGQPVESPTTIYFPDLGQRAALFIEPIWFANDGVTADLADLYMTVSPGSGHFTVVWNDILPNTLAFKWRINALAAPNV